MRYTSLVRTIISLCHTRDKRLRSVRGCFDAVRAYFAGECVPVNPMGHGNSKTGLPGWYRPTGCGDGGSCPPSCPYLGRGCYGQGGMPAALAARRADMSVDAAVHAYIACAVVSLLHHGRPHRGLTTGDLCRDGRIDRELIRALIDASLAIRDVLDLGDEYTGYLYTHADLDAETREQMLQAGIPVLLSDRLEPGGAIVYPLDALPALRKAHPDTRIVECPAFRRGASCRTCALCPRAQRLGICIALAPHGTQERKVRETALALQH